MKWKNMGQSLIGISDPKKILEVLEKEDPSSRYLLSNSSKKSIISNVPPELYSLKLQKYIPPQKVKNRSMQLIENLKDNLDIVQNDPNMASNYADKKPFQLGECFENSKGILFITTHLKKSKIIKIKKNAQFVLGYIESKILFGSQFGNYVVEMENLLFHDWHAWNYIDNMLVDITLLKNGGVLPPSAQTPVWGKANDHVFIYPPKTIKYWGKRYTDLKLLNNDIEKFSIEFSVSIKTEKSGSLFFKFWNPL